MAVFGRCQLRQPHSHAAHAVYIIVLLLSGPEFGKALVTQLRTESRTARVSPPGFDDPTTPNGIPYLNEPPPEFGSFNSPDGRPLQNGALPGSSVPPSPDGTQIQGEGLQMLGPEDGTSATTFMVMSSAKQRKVAYAQIENFQAVDNAVCPLIDSGLQDPRGIAFHAGSESLYIADFGHRQIFHYGIRAQPRQPNSVRVQCPGFSTLLLVNSVQRSVVTEVMAHAVVTDSEGNLYYADEETNSVSRISLGVLLRLADGSLSASDLHRQVGAKAINTIDAAVISSLFWSPRDAHIHKPSGIAVDSAGNVLWASQSEGDMPSVVSFGRVSRISASDSLNDTVVARVSVAAESETDISQVAVSSKMTVFTVQDRAMFGICNNIGHPVLLADRMKAPRGLLWDHDNAMFVADSAGDAVYQFSTSSCRRNVPMRRVVDFPGVYGIALVKCAAATVLPTQDTSVSQIGSRALAYVMGLR